MLRIRVALVLVLFYLIGAAYSGWLNHYSWPLIIGVLAVFLSYGGATCFNDLADVKADQINLKNATDRPLANQSATRRQIIIVGSTTVLLSIVGGFTLGLKSGLMIVVAAFINLTYSLPPLRVSYRPLLVPFFLSLGYVVIPFLCAYYGYKSQLPTAGWIFLAGLYSMFIARINLKDFRDRVGDKAAGKPTMLLRYGKRPVITLSFVSLYIGCTMVIIGLQPAWVVTVGIIILTLLVSYFLLRLLKQKETMAELLCIGMGARFGNGILFIIFGYLVITFSQPYNRDNLIIYNLLVIAIFISQFLVFIRSPQAFKYGGGTWRLARDSSK